MSAIPEHLIERAKRITGKRTAIAAVRELVETAEGKAPNTATARALRSKPNGRTFDSAKAAVAFLRERYR